MFRFIKKIQIDLIEIVHILHKKINGIIKSIFLSSKILKLKTQKLL